MLRYVLLGGALVLASACGSKTQTVLTGNSTYEMRSSIITLSAGLTPDRRQEFEQAIATIIFAANDRGLVQNGEVLTPAAIGMLKGRTVTQIIENAKLLRTAARY